MKIPNVLITGGAGYIGSELVENFLHNGFQVHVVDDLRYGHDSLLRYAHHPHFEFDKFDVRDTQKLSALLKKADVVVPLAALVGFPLCEEKPREAEEVNYQVNKWIAENKSPSQVVVYPCTNSGYGAVKGNVPCTEESPITPISVYGKTKVEAEKVYQQTENCVTLRLATVFGPSSRMRTDLLVNNFVWKAVKDKVIVLYECSFMRNYIHINDVCRAFLHVLFERDKCINQTFNVGNDAINSNKLELAEAIKKHVNVEIIKAEINSDPDVRNYIVSSQKLYNTGFSCQVHLDTGIRQLLKTYKMIDTVTYGNY